MLRKIIRIIWSNGYPPGLQRNRKNPLNSSRLLTCAIENKLNSHLDRFEPFFQKDRVADEIYERESILNITIKLLRSIENNYDLNVRIEELKASCGDK